MIPKMWNIKQIYNNIGIVCVPSLSFETVFVVLMQKVSDPIEYINKVVPYSEICKTGDRIIVTAVSYKIAFIKHLISTYFNV